jgi:hypothetical protein
LTYHRVTDLNSGDRFQNFLRGDRLYEGMNIAGITGLTSEAYSAALQVYNYKASGQGAGLEAVVDELGQRFARKSKKEKPQPTAV